MDSVHETEEEERSVVLDTEFGQIVHVDGQNKEIVSKWVGQWQTREERAAEVQRELDEKRRYAERMAAVAAERAEAERLAAIQQAKEQALAAEFEERRRAITKTVRVDEQIQRQLDKLVHKQVGWERNSYPDTWPKAKVEDKIAELRAQLSV